MLQNIFKNDKGATLIEVLASLVILSIVLIGFFTMFTQSALMQNVTEDEVIATNLVRQGLEDVRELAGNTVEPGTYSNFNQDGLPQIPSVNTDGQFLTNPDHYLILEVEEEPVSSRLLKATISITDEEQNVKTQTYTYIEVDS
ncbi:type IV pilus modification PilV family protein [Alkalibacillus aidingensis]|uniref:type IV pilus modification PilV family protein n=1 Tax=Alkalibacillus aidingensis TaxID=2747607 RepID=UPI001661246E|nr:prepilin-type N-terminal cleavage/methylation domain-containing protein [Alkalibacillus aidingensis]